MTCSCTSRTAIAPSPTAEATRLTDPLLTSPTANTPGRLVSRRGCRRAGEDEPVVVERDASGEPGRARVGADEHEERPGVDASRSGVVVLDDDGLQPVADELAYLGVEHGPRPGGALDPVDQVARHVCPRSSPRTSRRTERGVLGQEDRRLAGRVAAAHHHDRVALQTSRSLPVAA